MKLISVLLAAVLAFYVNVCCASEDYPDFLDDVDTYARNSGFLMGYMLTKDQKLRLDDPFQVFGGDTDLMGECYEKILQSWEILLLHGSKENRKTPKNICEEANPVKDSLLIKQIKSKSGKYCDNLGLSPKKIEGLLDALKGSEKICHDMKTAKRNAMCNALTGAYAEIKEFWTDYKNLLEIKLE